MGNWPIQLSERFIKDVGDVDAKLQGRVLRAITTICRDPSRTQGDTVKPLEKNLKGYWRYRVGDYRLVYKIDEAVHQVVLLWFSDCENVYQDR